MSALDGDCNCDETFTCARHRPIREQLEDILALTTARPRPLRSMAYSFPQLALEPGEERSEKVDVRGLFRAQRLLMAAEMDVVRGSLWLKRSRLPRIDREAVIFACTELRRNRRGRRRWFTPKKTIVCFKHAGQICTREYLPSSVVYEPVDPLSYIVLRNFFVGREPMLAGNVGASIFNSPLMYMPCPPSDMAITLVLKNASDVRVRVRASVLGIGQ